MNLSIFLFVLCLVAFCSQVYQGHYVAALFDFILMMVLLDNIHLRAIIERQKKLRNVDEELISKMTDKELDEISKRPKNELFENIKLNGTS